MTAKPPLRLLAARIGRGYLGLLQAIAVVLAVAAAAAVCGAVIAAPLWLFATRATAAYNIFIAAAAVAAVAGTVAVRLVRRAKTTAGSHGALAGGLLIAARAVAVLVIGYLDLLLFSRSGAAAGLIGLPVALVLIGLLLFGRRGAEKTG